MATRLIPVDSADPVLPASVLNANAASTVELLAAVSDRFITPNTLYATLPEYDVRIGGVVGDGIVDDGATLNTILAAHTDKTLVIPRGLNIRTTVPITPATGNRIRGYGATLTNDCPAVDDRLIEIVAKSDIIIEGLELDGAKASYGTVTEQRHDVWIENSDDITLRDIYAHDAKGDGYYVGDNNTAANYCKRVTLINCVGDANHRNGLSVVAVDGFYSFGGRFINQSGTSPQAGFDVEPNAATTVCRNIWFYGTHCADNVGPAMGVAFHATGTAALQSGVHIIGGVASGSTDVTGGAPGTAVGRGFSIRNPRSVWISDVEVRNNAADGCYIDSTGTAQDLHISRCTIANSGYHGAEVWNVPDVEWDQCWFLDNSQATVNTYDGLSLMPTSATVGARITRCKFNGTQQRYGLRTGSNLSQLWLFYNDFATMGTADTSLADDVTTRIDINVTNFQLPSATEIRWNGSEIRLWRNSTDLLRTNKGLLVDGVLTLSNALDHNGTTVGFYNVTPVTRPTAYTQTFATADKTHAARTAVVLTDSSGGTANTTIQAMADPTDTPATADALRDDLVANLLPAIRNNFADLVASDNKIIADLADTAAALNAVIDDLQALGLLQ